ncbi:hypothetical protein ACFWJS_40250 [Streptomyces sp. NPDC127061]|uniref:hypothetical protein n=1 Tax=Streptomyces sp. NPDC127061 TaxID=3347122 RepID=UPI00365521F0
MTQVKSPAEGLVAEVSRPLVFGELTILIATSGLLAISGDYHPLTESGAAPTVLVKETNPGSGVLAPPVRFEQLYRHPELRYTVWRPVAPAGYRAMTDVLRHKNEEAPTPSNTHLWCVKETKVNGWSYAHITDEASPVNLSVPFGSIAVPFWTVAAPAYTDVNSGVMIRPGLSVVWGGNPTSRPAGSPVQYVLNLPVTSVTGEEPERPVMPGYGKPVEKTPEMEDFRVKVPCLAIQDRHKDLAWQVKNSPTYTIRRLRCYSLVKHLHNESDVPQTTGRTVTYGISKSTTETYRESVGVSIGFETGVSIFGIGGTVSTTVSTELGYERSTQVSEMFEETHNEPLVVPPYKAAALYCAHHKLQVIREDDTLAGDHEGIDFDVRNSYLVLQYPPAQAAELAAQDGQGELAVGGGTFMDAPTPFQINSTR